MKIDFKITSWERIIIPDEIGADIPLKVRKGEITSVNDIFEQYNDGDFTFKPIDNTDEQMEVSENGGFPTIEVYAEDPVHHDYLICDNTDKYMLCKSTEKK